jgi:hypothetical protein
MKKKRKFEDGGFLSEEAKAAGLSMGRNPNIREADRAAAIAEVERNVAKAKGMSDKDAELLMKYDLLPADMQIPAGQAESVPVPAPRANAGRPLAPRATPRAEPVVTPSRNDYSMNEQEGSGRGTSTPGRSFPQRTDFMGDPTSNPSRGSYKENGPLGDAGDAIGRLLRNLPHNRQLRKERLLRERPLEATPMKKGGAVKASKRADGIAQRGKTKGRMI